MNNVIAPLEAGDSYRFIIHDFVGSLNCFLHNGIINHMTVGNFFLGLIITAIGFIFVWRTDWPLSLIGPTAFGQKWFMGGSRTFYKLLGIIICVLGLLTMVGLIDNVMNGLAGFLVG